MVKGNLYLLSPSLHPFFRLPQSSSLFAEMKEWVFFRLFSVFGGIISVKLHGFIPVEFLNPRHINLRDNFISFTTYLKQRNGD
ncbi:MAG: hypothetical protein BGO67_12090 [Alphaproteobacteria bacterium 41-28]|nr:MAG: hypothetical protein BGO67_12090 [Alphaproteobacteria bacterium 41-28]